MDVLCLVCCVVLAVITMAPLPCEGCTVYGQCLNTSDTLAFSKDNADQDDVRKEHLIKICCCASGFHGNIQWYRPDSSGTFQPFSPRSDNYVFQKGSRRQLLTIHSTSMSDNGTYLCKAYNGSRSVEFNFTLIVHSCEDAVGEVVVEHSPPESVYVNVGQMLTMKCVGYFGCQQMPGMSFWIAKDNDVIRSLSNSNTSFYSTTKITQSGGTVVGDALTLKKVTEANLTTQYTCYLMVTSNNRKLFNVHLKRKSHPPIFILLGAGCFIVVTFFVAILVSYIFRDRITFWAKTKFHCFPPRIGETLYDLCLLSTYERNHLMSVMKETLTDFGYRVYLLQDDDRDGAVESKLQFQALDQSSHVLIYLSSMEETEHFHQFFIKSATHIQGGSRIIIVYDGSIREILKNKQLDPNLRGRLNTVKHIKWPDSDNQRLRRNFWCSLRSCLPEVKTRGSDDTDSNRQSSASAEPLLSTASTS